MKLEIRSRRRNSLPEGSGNLGANGGANPRRSSAPVGRPSAGGRTVAEGAGGEVPAADEERCGDCSTTAERCVMGSLPGVSVHKTASDGSSSLPGVPVQKTASDASTTPSKYGSSEALTEPSAPAPQEVLQRLQCIVLNGCKTEAIARHLVCYGRSNLRLAHRCAPPQGRSPHDADVSSV